MTLHYGFSDHTLRARVTNTLQVDSAGRLVDDSMTTVADLSLSARTDSADRVQAEGVIRDYSRSPYPRFDPDTSLVVIAPLRFVALRSDTVLRIVAQPALGNECDREETSALALVSELLVPLPDTLSVGDVWTDVARTFSCRGDVPMTAEWRSTYTVDSLLHRDGDNDNAIIAAITRTIALDISGTSTTTWSKTEVRATGNGRLHYLMRVPDAAPVQVVGETALTVLVTSTDRLTQPVRATQRTVYHLERQR